MKNIWPLRSIKVTLLICLLALFADAQSPEGHMSSRQSNGQPISSILNADGSIKRGISGSFDPKGFRMGTGPDGAPRFVSGTKATSSLSPTTDCNDGWDDRFFTNGVDGSVTAIASDGAGNLYVGGHFSVAGNKLVNNIAKWDGTSWSALGTGVTSEIDTDVRAIAVSGMDVYVAGYFTMAGGVPANNIAKWDGTSWSALGAGVTGETYSYVQTIAVSGTDVYVAGYFTMAGGGPANNIAKWNGSSWSALGAGVIGGNYASVQAIAVSGSNVYVGGYFTTAGGVPANNIAKWNGSSWSALGLGLTAGFVP